MGSGTSQKLTRESISFLHYSHHHCATIQVDIYANPRVVQHNWWSFLVLGGFEIPSSQFLKTKYLLFHYLLCLINSFNISIHILFYLHKTRFSIALMCVYGRNGSLVLHLYRFICLCSLSNSYELIIYISSHLKQGLISQIASLKLLIQLGMTLDYLSSNSPLLRAEIR